MFYTLKLWKSSFYVSLIFGKQYLNIYYFAAWNLCRIGLMDITSSITGMLLLIWVFFHINGGLIKTSQQIYNSSAYYKCIADCSIKQANHILWNAECRKWVTWQRAVLDWRFNLILIKTKIIPWCDGCDIIPDAYIKIIGSADQNLRNWDLSWEMIYFDLLKLENTQLD